MDKRPYVTPQLQTLGTVRELTQTPVNGSVAGSCDLFETLVKNLDDCELDERD